LLVPYIDIDCQPVHYQFRPDTPQLAKDGKPIKHETPAKAAMRLDMGAAAQSHRRRLAVSIYRQRYVPPLECGNSVPAL
jgi:hypothetical protein